MMPDIRQYHSGFFYIFDTGHEDQTYKVGWTGDNWNKRLKTLRAGNHKMNCIGAYWIYPANIYEGKLKDILEHDLGCEKISGEIYRIDDKNIETLKEMLEILADEYISKYGNPKKYYGDEYEGYYKKFRNKKINEEYLTDNQISWIDNVFKKSLYFWNWMNKEEKECSVCGIVCEITASIIDTEYPNYENAIRLCEQCYSNIKYW